MTHLHWPAFFAQPEWSRRTAGSRQPLLVHDAGPLENNDIRGAQTQVSQERRPLARRGSVNRTLPRENRTLCSGYRTPNQERRASARRGSVRLCNGVDSPRLAYASRSWCATFILPKNTDICDAEMNTHESGGR
jgi:hypothetical protein